MPETDTGRWTVIFDGHLLQRKEREAACARFKRRFSADSRQLAQIFSGRTVVLRTSLPRGAAQKFQTDLGALGMRCRVVADAVAPKPARDAEAQPNAAVCAGKVYSEAEIDAAFEGDFERPRATLLYRLSLMAVATLMLALPLTYFALIGVSAYGVYWHTSSNIGLIAGGASTYLGLLLYATPIIAGVFLVFFLVKPLVVPPARVAAPVVLDPLRQPAFFYLVEKITERVGASMPREIRVDANVNASASLRRGVFSNELVLTVGLPLVLGMNVQTLSGILAHEFGHFAQRSGLRLRHVIGGINHWFYRRAHQPDVLDERVEELCSSDHTVGVTIGYLATGGIWLSRRLLAVLAKIAAIVSMHMVRQIEYDADRYEVALTGSAQFRDTAVRLRVLAAGYEAALNRVQESWRDDKLPDNLPSLTVRYADGFDDTAIARIKAGIAVHNSDVLDPHPPDVARIRAAEKRYGSVVLTWTSPAERLLHNVDKLCRNATFAWYRDQSFEFTSDNLVPVDYVLMELARQSEQYEALGRYLGQDFIPRRVLPLPSLDALAGEGTDVLGEELRAWQEPVDAADAAALGRRLEALLSLRVNLGLAQMLARMGVTFDPASYGAKSDDRFEIEREMRQSVVDQDAVARTLDEHDRVLGRRMGISLSLGCRNGHLSRETVDNALAALRALAPLCADCDSVIALEYRLRTLVAYADVNPNHAMIKNAIDDALEEFQTWVDRINEDLIRTPNPLRDGGSLADAVWQWTPDGARSSFGPNEAADALRGIVAALEFLNTHVTAELAENAEGVETHSGYLQSAPAVPPLRESAL